MRPVLSREVIKGEQPFFVFFQTVGRSWVLGLVTGDELIIGFQSGFSGRRLIHFVDQLFGAAGATPPDNSFLHLGLALRAKSLYFPLQVHPFFLAPRVSTPFFFGYRKDAPFFILSSTTFGYSSTNIAARLTFHGSKIIKGQIRISWPLVFFEPDPNHARLRRRCRWIRN